MQSFVQGILASDLKPWPYEILPYSEPIIIIHETPSNRVLKQAQTVIKIEFLKEEVKIGETWRICRCLTTQYIYWKVQILQQGNRLKPDSGKKRKCPQKPLSKHYVPCTEQIFAAYCGNDFNSESFLWEFYFINVSGVSLSLLKV